MRAFFDLATRSLNAVAYGNIGYRSFATALPAAGTGDR